MGKRGNTGCHLKGRIREENNSWKGGKTINRGRLYLYKPEHPDSGQNGYILESRLIVSNLIGRSLKNTEIVHHIDSNINNNEPSNLQLLTCKEHVWVHRPPQNPVICYNCKISFTPKRKPRCAKTFCSRNCYISWRWSK